MAAVTAVIMVGISHPNDTGVNPEVILKLWEGSRAVWTAHKIGDSRYERRAEPDEPATIMADGCKLARDTAVELNLNAVMISSSSHSSINSQILSGMEMLEGLDVYITQQTGSRTNNQWSGGWESDGILAQ